MAASRWDGAEHSRRHPSGVSVGCLGGDLQNPPELEAEPVDIAIGLTQGVANGVSAQGIVFRLFLGITELDARKTVGALVHQLPRQAPAFSIPLDARLDHDDFGLNQSKIMNVIDSNSLERNAGGKPVSTFPHPALEPESCSKVQTNGTKP